MVCQGLPGDVPGSTVVDRDVPGRDFKRWSSLPGSAVFTPECTVLTPGCTYLYLCHYTVPLPGCAVLAVDLVMDLVETTIFLPDIFTFLFFSSFSLDFRRS